MVTVLALPNRSTPQKTARPVRQRMPAIRAIIRLFVTLVLITPAVLTADEPTNVFPPLRILAGEPISSSQQNRLAEIEGTVTFVGKNGRSIYLEISSATGPVPATLQIEPGPITDLLLKSRIHAWGRCVAVHSSANDEMTGSLLITNINDITFLQLPEETWQRYPLSSISDVNESVIGQIFHLRASVISTGQGVTLLISDSTGQLNITTALANLPLIGATVEILGLWKQEGTGRHFQSIFLKTVAASGNQTSLPTLTTTEQVRWLSPPKISC
jgi:hypothetical protein